MFLSCLSPARRARCWNHPPSRLLFHSNAGTWPYPVFSSTRLTVRKSMFEAHVSPVSSKLFSSTEHSPSVSVPQSVSPHHTGQMARHFGPLFDELTRLYPRTKRATHCMYAWRISTPGSLSSIVSAKGGSKHAGGYRASAEATTPSPHIFVGSISGGEAGAGERLERLLELSAACKSRDVILVVYRWYGGVKLGSERWKCISDVAKEALGVAAEKGWT